MYNAGISLSQNIFFLLTHMYLSSNKIVLYVRIERKMTKH